MADVLGASLGHARHDRLTVAAAVGRGPAFAAAQALLAACTECARLHADLRALATALPLTATPRRPRDFSLTPADAERLRPRGLRHWLSLIGTARDTITRPLAIGLTTIGLAGLLVASVPGFLPSAGGTAAAPSAAPSAAAQDGGFQQQVTAPGRESLPEDRGRGDAAGSPAMTAPAPEPSLSPATPGPFVVLSASFLAAGGGLFVVRRVKAAGNRRPPGAV